MRKGGRTERNESRVARLQWGRTFSSAESARMQRRLRQRTSTSMGPHFFKCGKPQDRKVNMTTLYTSMGPHFFKCGKPRIRPRLRRHAPHTSMGPHFFKCGKLRIPPNTPRNTSAYFNGAALFQVRKGACGGYDGGAGTRHFNGAALFQVRKASVRFKKQSTAECTSMGPHFFKCGKRLG